QCLSSERGNDRSSPPDAKALRRTPFHPRPHEDTGSRCLGSWRGRLEEEHERRQEEDHESTKGRNKAGRGSRKHERTKTRKRQEKEGIQMSPTGSTHLEVSFFLSSFVFSSFRAFVILFLPPFALL